MIRRSDLLISNLTFCMISYLGLLPISFQWTTGTIHIHTEFGVRKMVWRVWQAQGLTYSLYMIFRLFQSSVLGAVVEFDHYAFHIGMTTFSIAMNFWSQALIQRFPIETEAIFNNNLSNCDFGESLISIFPPFSVYF